MARQPHRTVELDPGTAYPLKSLSVDSLKALGIVRGANINIDEQSPIDMEPRYFVPYPLQLAKKKKTAQQLLVSLKPWPHYDRPTADSRRQKIMEDILEYAKAAIAHFTSLVDSSYLEDSRLSWVSDKYGATATHQLYRQPFY